ESFAPRRTPNEGSMHYRSDEPVNVLRHDHVSQHYKAILLPRFFQESQEKIAAPRRPEPGPPLITTAGDEVQIPSAVLSLQTLRHAGDGNASTRASSVTLHTPAP